MYYIFDIRYNRTFKRELKIFRSFYFACFAAKECRSEWIRPLENPIYENLIMVRISLRSIYKRRVCFNFDLKYRRSRLFIKRQCACFCANRIFTSPARSRPAVTLPKYALARRITNEEQCDGIREVRYERVKNAVKFLRSPLSKLQRFDASRKSVVYV